MHSRTLRTGTLQFSPRRAATRSAAVEREGSPLRLFRLLNISIFVLEGGERREGGSTSFLVREVTVTRLHPPRLRRLAIFLIQTNVSLLYLSNPRRGNGTVFARSRLRWDCFLELCSFLIQPNDVRMVGLVRPKTLRLASAVQDNRADTPWLSLAPFSH